MNAGDRKYIRDTVRRILREELASFGAALAEHLESTSFAQVGGYDGMHEYQDDTEYVYETEPEMGFGAMMRQKYPRA